MISRLSWFTMGVVGIPGCDIIYGGKSAQIKDKKLRQEAFQFYSFWHGNSAASLQEA
jgi:hypothetical protein